VKELVKAELYRLLKSRTNKIIILIFIAVTALFMLRINTFPQFQEMNDDGELMVYTGKSAIENQQKATEDLEGQVTSEKLANSIKLYQKAYKKYEGDLNDTNFYYEIGYLDDYLTLWRGISDGNNVYEILANIDPEQVSATYYTLQKKAVIKKMGDLNIAGKTLIFPPQIMNSNVTTPYVYHAGYNSSVLDHLTFLIMLYVLLFTLLFSSIYSGSYTDYTDSIIRTSKHGKNMIAHARNLTSFIIVTILYWGCMLLFMLHIRIFYTEDSLRSSIQMIVDATCFVPLTVLQAQRLIALAGYITSLAVSAAILFFSSKTSSPSKSIMAGTVVFLTPIFLGFLSQSNIFLIISALFPSGGSGLLNCFEVSLFSYNYIYLGNLAIWYPIFIIACEIFEIPIFYFAAVSGYCHHKYH